MEKNKLVKAAKLYYFDQYTQSQIAKELGVERSTVSRLLKKTREVGIVKISIDENSVEKIELEEKLKEKYNLKDVILSSRSPFASEELYGNVHEYLEKCTCRNETVGVTWGKTLCNFSKYKPENRKKKLNFIAVTGGYGNISEYTHINSIINNLSMTYGGAGYFIDFTLIVDSKKTRDGIYESRFFNGILDTWNKRETVLVGIGAAEKESNVIWASDLKVPDKLWNDILSGNPVGEICTRFYNAHGDLIKTEITDRTIGIDIEKFKKMKNVIGIASGNKKAESIKTALEAGYINILATDINTAKRLV